MSFLLSPFPCSNRLQECANYKDSPKRTTPTLRTPPDEDLDFGTPLEEVLNYVIFIAGKKFL